MRRLCLISTLVLALPAATAITITDRPSPAQTAGAGGDILPFTATEQTLANGLKVIIVPTGFPNLVAVQIPVQTGSRNEVESGRSGFAHFFEHLMFRGTPSYPPEKYRDIVTKAGARENATTGDDFTRYYATFAKDDLDTMLKVYADMFQNLSYAEADFKTEARAILGEYNKNVADPLEKLVEVQRDTAFTTHTYKHTTMGFIRDIENMPNEYAYSKTFFERWYRPQYTALVIAGDVAPAQVMPIVERYWGGWKPATGNPPPIPAEPAPRGPQYVHVPWSSPTQPYVTVAFRAPAFSDTGKDYAAMQMVSALFFGATSDLHRKLVVAEQKVDTLAADSPGNVDPALFTIFARVKNAADAVYVRDEILRTVAAARARPVPARRLDDAKSFNRYSLVRSLDSTDRIAAVLARYVAYHRSYATINNLYRVFDSLTAADLQQAAQKYFTDQSLIVATLSRDPLPTAIERAPSLDVLPPAAGSRAMATPARRPSFRPSAPEWPTTGNYDTMIVQRSPLPQITLEIMCRSGSQDDPKDKEGLAALAGAMVAEAGSARMTIDEIRAALYPMAGSFTAQVDKEVTTFTASIHKDNWLRFFEIVLPQLLEPGFRPEDFKRLKARQMSALVEDLRASNEEELGKERLQENVFRWRGGQGAEGRLPWAHPVLGTVAGIEAITLGDVKAFVAQYGASLPYVGVAGDVPDDFLSTLKTRLEKLPAVDDTRDTGVPPAMAPLRGIEVEIIEKDTRGTFISLGHPIAVTRQHADFPALSVARAWLGEHRASTGRLYQRIREVRGMNYGDYAYIEAFPRGMSQFFPDPNLVRHHQVFEIWIRPVVPAHAHMALRIAIHELDALIRNGISKEDFEATRGYLMKNVYVMTARQDQQLGYALDSHWYGILELTQYLRGALARLTPEDVNRAVRQHLSATNLSVVIVTKNTRELRDRLVSDAFSPIVYDGEKPRALLEEDKVIGALKLGINPAKVRITPVAEVFAR